MLQPEQRHLDELLLLYSVCVCVIRRRRLRSWVASSCRSQLHGKHDYVVQERERFVLLRYRCNPRQSAASSYAVAAVMTTHHHSSATALI